MNLRICKYHWHSTPPQIRDIRQRVFVEEQQVPAELEWDDTDHSAQHFLALTDDNLAVATARLYGAPADDALGHIGRMAVLPEYRGKQIGQRLLQHIITESVEQYSQLRLSAQHHAIEFYQRAGFHLCSDQYQEAGIAHFDMRCLAPAVLAAELNAVHIPERPGTRNYPLNLGADSRSWLFDRPQQMRELMGSLAGQARQRVWLYDATLDHELYGRPDFCELISQVARRHRHSDVRLLITDYKPLIQRRHGLVELMRRLPSSIELRLLHDTTVAEKKPFMLADRQGVLYRHQFGGAQGFANFADGGRVKRLEQRFTQMWNISQPPLELRQLSL